MKIKKVGELKEARKFKFDRVGGVKRDELWLHIMYEGGDADTKHPEKFKLPWKFSEWEQHEDDIRAVIDQYERLKKVLDCGSYGGRVRGKKGADGKYRHVITKYGRPDVEIDDDLQDLIDSVPNDPQNDYQDKCYLDSMRLVGYDQDGNKHESYV